MSSSGVQNFLACSSVKHMQQYAGSSGRNSLRETERVTRLQWLQDNCEHAEAPVHACPAITVPALVYAQIHTTDFAALSTSTPLMRHEALSSADMIKSFNVFGDPDMLPASDYSISQLSTPDSYFRIVSH
jgi:hypothetical protein